MRLNKTTFKLIKLDRDINMQQLNRAVIVPWVLLLYLVCHIFIQQLSSSIISLNKQLQYKIEYRKSMLICYSGFAFASEYWVDIPIIANQLTKDQLLEIATQGYFISMESGALYLLKDRTFLYSIRSDTKAKMLYYTDYEEVVSANGTIMLKFGIKKLL